MEANRGFYESLSYKDLKNLLDVSKFYDSDEFLKEKLETSERALVIAQANIDRVRRQIQLRIEIIDLLERKRIQELK